MRFLKMGGLSSGRLSTAVELSHLRDVLTEVMTLVALVALVAPVDPAWPLKRCF